MNFSNHQDLVQKLVQGSVFLVAAVGAVYLSSLVVDENYRFVVLALLILMVLPFAWTNLWLLEGLLVPCSLLAGGIAYASGFTPFHLVSIVFLGLFVLKHFNSIRFVRLEWKPPFFMLVTLFLLVMLLLFHMVDLNLGLTRPKGVGGLKIGLTGLMLFLVFLKFVFFGIDPRALRFAPFLSIGVAVFLLFLELGSRYIPSLHYQLRSIYDTNWEFMYSDTFQKFQEAFFRIQTLRELGLFLLIAGISFFDRKKFFGFRSLACLLACLLGLGCMVGSGYRAYATIGFLISLLGLIIQFRILSFYPIVVLSLVFAGVIALQGSAFELPLQVQRSLKWLPGDWDVRITQEESGAEWRLKLWQAYLDQIRPSVYWIGQGQQITTGVTEASSVQLLMATDTSALQMFVDMKALHSGFLTTMDIVGVPGVILLFGWMVYGLIKGISTLIRTGFSSPLIIWFFLYFAWNWPGYWYTGSFPNSFAQLILSTILLAYVCDSEAARAPQPPALVPDSPARPRFADV